MDLRAILKELDDEWDEDEVETTKFIDTGSYALNALLCGSIYNGGLADNRTTMFAGEESTGKTFFMLGILRNWLEKNPNGAGVIWDTEFALDKDMLRKRGVDPDRMFLKHPDTIQAFRTDILKLLEAYKAVKKKQPLFLSLDSLGNLASLKEQEDALKGVNVRDMTRSQILRSLFRLIMSQLGVNKVPMIVTNHTYDQMDTYKPKEISGGGGAKFASSTIITLTKSKEKETDTGPVIGSLIRAYTWKSRFSKMHQSVQLRLHYSKGLDRYYGLLDLAEKYDIMKKVSTKYEMPDGSLHFGKHIENNPEKYFTKDILDKLEIAAGMEYKLGE